MKRFIATLSGGSSINIPADRVEYNTKTKMLMVYDGEVPVACVGVSALITAHISKKED